jgi:hypothetical protein
LHLGNQLTEFDFTGKAEVQSRRNEQLARKNPDRIQKQIDEYKAIGTNGGKLTTHQEQVLDGLEKELRAVKKAREALGDKAPPLRKEGWGGGGGFGDRDRVLGKRRRGDEDASTTEEEGDETPEDVRRIPMPRDTPPPIPKEVLDQWYGKRRARRAAAAGESKNANDTPLGSNDRRQEQPPEEAKTVYEAKPVVRDLKKEAVTAFVPTHVKMKLDKGKGAGGLMEPEEADRLEREGYLKMKEGRAGSQGQEGDAASSNVKKATVEDAEEEEG